MAKMAKHAANPEALAGDFEEGRDQEQDQEKAVPSAAERRRERDPREGVGAEAPGSRDVPDDSVYAYGAQHYTSQRASRRTRRLLIVVIVLAIAVIVAVAAVTVSFIMRDNQQAAQSAQDREITTDAGVASDASDPTESSTEVPDLVSVLTLTREEAVSALGHGAQETNEASVDEEDNPVRSIVTVELSDEPTDSRTGTPSVYLSLDEDGAIIEVSYAAGVSQLGYGSMSFSDAVSSAHIVEATLRAAGVEVADGAAMLPEDAAEYTTYAEDGSIRSERYSFTGVASSESGNLSWTVSLVYDYTSSAASGNVSNATRRLTLTLAEAE